MANATMHVKSAFGQVKEQFLSVIDHLETEQDQIDDEARDEHNQKVETDLKNNILQSIQGRTRRARNHTKASGGKTS